MIFVIVPQQIASTSEYGLDPAFFPLTLLWLIVAMGVLLVATRIRQPPDPPDQEPVLDGANWAFIVGASLFLLLGFVAIKTLGFVIAGTLMIAILMIVIELRNLHWLEVIGIAAIAPFTIYWLLYHVFSVQLPWGVLFP